MVEKTACAVFSRKESRMRGVVMNGVSSGLNRTLLEEKKKRELNSK